MYVKEAPQILGSGRSLKQIVQGGKARNPAAGDGTARNWAFTTSREARPITFCRRSRGTRSGQISSWIPTIRILRVDSRPSDTGAEAGPYSRAIPEADREMCHTPR